MALPLKLVNRIGELIFKGTEESLNMAEFWLRNASQNDPHTHYLWGILYSHRERFSEAVAAHERAVELTQRANPFYLYNYAIALGLNRHVDEAIQELQYTLSQFPNHLLSYVGMARLLAEKNEYTKAITYIEYAFQLAGKIVYPEHYLSQWGTPTPNQQRALLLFLQGAMQFPLQRFDDAIESVRQSLGYFHDCSDRMPLSALAPDYVEIMRRAYGTVEPFLNFLVSAQQAEAQEGNWQVAIPLFTFEQWMARLPEADQLKCFDDLNRAVLEVPRTGNWLPALRAAMNWHAAAGSTAPPESSEPASLEASTHATERPRDMPWTDRLRVATRQGVGAHRVDATLGTPIVPAEREQAIADMAVVERTPSPVRAPYQGRH